jgi:hypothetical protein
MRLFSIISISPAKSISAVVESLFISSGKASAAREITSPAAAARHVFNVHIRGTYFPVEMKPVIPNPALLTSHPHFASRKPSRKTFKCEPISEMSSKAEQLRQVNSVLEKLAKDEDLQDDFKLPIVRTAIDHWTGKNRLDPEKAQLLQNNRRVVYVLQRFQMLQSVCKEALMPVPLDHLLAGKKELDISVVAQYFPLVYAGATNVPKSGATIDTSQSLAAPSSAAAPSVSAQERTVHRLDEQATRSSSSAPVATTVHAPAPTSGVDVNSLLKLAIAVVFVLIAVTLSQLLKS